MAQIMVRSEVPSRQVTSQQAMQAFLNVLSPEGIKASDDQLFKAIFGRDTIRGIRDVMDLPHFQPIVRMGIVSLIYRQGSEYHPLRMEAPGKIHHEDRALYFAHERIPPDQEAIMHKLAGKWGWLSDEASFCSYDSLDATPHFVIAVCEYVDRYGHDFLDQRIHQRNGDILTVRQSVQSALRWIEQEIDKSNLGLLESLRTNPQGHLWPYMRDGRLAYAHEDGTLANCNAPIASLDVQGLVYEALTLASICFKDDLRLQNRIKQWEEMARHIQNQIFSAFWMEEEFYICMGLDRDPATGHVRQIKTLSSMPGELLETGLFDTLSGGERSKYIGAIVRMLYSPQFLTAVGIRSRGLRHVKLFGYDIWDYQGSRTVWGVTTNAFARGLRRQGMACLAQDMENRMANASGVAGSITEFYYVGVDGRVVFDPKGSVVTSDDPEVILGTNIPEHSQAWTISALLRILSEHHVSFPNYQLERDILKFVHPTRRLPTSKLAAKFPLNRAYWVATEETKHIENTLLIKNGIQP